MSFCSSTLLRCCSARVEGSMPDVSFMTWLQHEFPDLYGVPPLEVRMVGPSGEMMRRPLTRTTWDHVWHLIHQHAKPGDVIRVSISGGES